jgi:hypothetical protein
MPEFHIQRFPISWPPLQSLSWSGSDLVDWVGGGRLWQPNGREIPAVRGYGDTFDRAIMSPSGRYCVIFGERQTKGLVLRDGEIVREINRSYYQADAYAYPIALGRVPDGREVIAHCPDDYNILEIETLDNGTRLTRRRGKAQDYFHSRLSFSPDGRYLLSAGWIWHPWSGFGVFDVERALRNPRLLDRKEGMFGNILASPDGGEVGAACWLNSTQLVVTTDPDGAYMGEIEHEVPPCSGIRDVAAGEWISRSSAWNPRASLYPCAGGALYVEHGHPHWWAPGRDAPLVWCDVNVVASPDRLTREGIVHDCPLLAVHPTEPRFAVVTEEEIVVFDQK